MCGNNENVNMKLLQLQSELIVILYETCSLFDKNTDTFKKLKNCLEITCQIFQNGIFINDADIIKKNIDLLDKLNKNPV